MTECKSENIDVIVVGAGPAGLSAALAVKRGGKNVVVLERATDIGSKNMFGGAVYLKSLSSILPNSYKNAPYERFLTSHTYSLLSENNSFDIKTKSFHPFLEGEDLNNEEYFKNCSAATVFRSKFDSWFMGEAKKEGVFVAPKTLVKNLIVKNGAVVGVQTELEKYFAPVVILADGVNSLLARQIGLRKEFFPKDMFLSVKETFKMEKNTLEERFGLVKNSKEGCAIEFLGGLSGFYEKAAFQARIKDKTVFTTPFAVGFLYTFKDSISLGLGVSLEDLSNYKIKPYELLEKLKSHLYVKNLLKDAQMQEYSAHLIPEGGYKNLPQLYDNGVLIAGDAAGFVNGAHFEGTNFAIESGKLAGEAALCALNAENVSKSALKIYERKLKHSFVLKDLKSYRNVIEAIYARKKSFLYYYPKKACEALKLVTTADNVPKKVKIRKFILSFLLDRSIIELFRDFKVFIKLFFEIVF